MPLNAQRLQKGPLKLRNYLFITTPSFLLSLLYLHYHEQNVVVEGDCQQVCSVDMMTPQCPFWKQFIVHYTKEIKAPWSYSWV